jgi:hypothetical protein
VTLSTWPGGPFPVFTLTRYEVTIVDDYYVAGKRLKPARVPPQELHLRGLFELDVTDREATAAFMTEHGWFAYIGGGLRGSAQQELGWVVPDTTARRNAIESEPRESDRAFRFLLTEEVEAGLVKLRNAVRTWHALSGDQQWNRLAEEWERDDFAPPKDAARACAYLDFAVNPGLADVHLSLRMTLPNAGQLPFDLAGPQKSLHTALCLMVYNDVDTGSPYFICHNEACRRLFRHKQGGAEFGQQRSKGVLYCSESCQQAQKSREYRRRKRAEGAKP